MNRDQSYSRRRFLIHTTAASAGLFACGPAIVTSRTTAQPGVPASSRIRIGHIGVRNQGTNNIRKTMAQTVAVCDVDRHVLAAAKDRVSKANGQTCKAYTDYRKMLEDKEVDAVVISTPDHWHALMAIHACETGKDVYCEKPLTLMIPEGRAIVRAARRFRRVVQTGSQQRSSPIFRRACELVRAGAVGKVHTIKVGLAAVNFSGPPVEDCDSPSFLDYDFWLGPAPVKAYNPKHVHYNFRFFWNYSGGQQTNWGAHHIDIAHWAMGMDESGPISAEGKGRFHPRGWYEVPSWSEVEYMYPNGVKLLCGMDHPMGTTFIGDSGTLYVNRGELRSDPPELVQFDVPEEHRLAESLDHFHNWFQCIQTREKPICDAEIGHRTATACHLGNIAIRSGRKVLWDPELERLKDASEDIRRYFSKPYRLPWVLLDAQL